MTERLCNAARASGEDVGGTSLACTGGEGEASMVLMFAVRS